jgi:putative transposase
LVDPDDEQLSITNQCALLGCSRSWYYYKPGKEPKREAKDEFDKGIIMKLSKTIPFYGYRKLSLEAEQRFGIDLSFKRTLRLCQELGVHAVVSPPPTSTPRTAHAVFPYLLKGKEISYSNQVWQVDITYIRLPTGTVYLCAIIDVFSRKVLSWNLANTMDVLLVLWPLTWALQSYGTPEIIHTDQGSQFTTEEWVALVEDLNIKVSMSSKGRALDNIFIERWWRSFKHENLFLNQYQTLRALRKGIENYIEFYNRERFHQALNYWKPNEVFFDDVEMMEKAS